MHWHNPLLIAWLFGYGAAFTVQPIGAQTHYAQQIRARHSSEICMGGGIKQPRPTVPYDPRPTSKFAAAALAPASPLPKLVVLDLDNTVWTPELYTLRRLENYDSVGPPGPVAGDDVWLLDGAAEALYELASCPLWADTRVAVASRTNKGAWARKLLSTFEIPGCPGRPLDSLMTGGIQIYPGSKLKHFEALRQQTGIDFEEMLFFDDSADGKYGNCAPVASLGVLSAHCPDGLTTAVWHSAVSTYAELASAGKPRGLVLRPDGSWVAGAAEAAGAEGGANAASSSLGTPRARVAKYLEEKGFGFVEILAEGDLKGQQVFFHRSKLSGSGAGFGRLAGAAASVSVARDRRGRLECSAVDLEGREGNGGGGGGRGEAAVNGVTLPCFSMNMPFAGLLARGIKTIESRNHTMFEGTDGSLALLHVGMRTSRRGQAQGHLRRGDPEGEVAGAPLDKGAIDTLTQLPDGLSRGSIVAILELGPDWLRSRAITDAVSAPAAPTEGTWASTSRRWSVPNGLPSPSRCAGFRGSRRSRCRAWQSRTDGKCHRKLERCWMER